MGFLEVTISRIIAGIVSGLIAGIIITRYFNNANKDINTDPKSEEG